MIIIKIIFPLSLTAYVALGAGDNPNKADNEPLIQDLTDRYDDYQSRQQNRGRPFRKPTIPIDNAENVNMYDNFMNQCGKTTIGEQDFSGTGLGKQDLNVEFTNDGVLDDGKKAPEYDIGNQDRNRRWGPNIDMVGDHFTIDGKKVTGNCVQFTDDGVLVDGRRAPEYNVGGNQGLIFDMTGDEIKINGQEVTGDSKRENHYNDSRITIDGKRYPGQVKGNKGTSQEFMGGGLTIDGWKIPGNVFGNQDITIDRTADGLIINNRKVPGVHAYNKIEIEWSQEGGIIVNNEKKTGFEDIKGKGMTILGSKLNPAYYIDGSGSSQGSKTDENEGEDEDESKDGADDESEYESEYEGDGEEDGEGEDEGEEEREYEGESEDEYEYNYEYENDDEHEYEYTGMGPNITTVQPSGLNKEDDPYWQIDKDLIGQKGHEGQTVNNYDDEITYNNKQRDNLEPIQPVIVDTSGDKIQIYGIENTGEELGIQDMAIKEDAVRNEHCNKHLNDLGFPTDGKTGSGQAVENQGVNFKKHRLMINDEPIPGGVFGNQDITIERDNDGFIINDKRVTGVDENDRVVIEYHEEGGITVNGEKKEGFEDIKGKGKTVLESKLNSADVDCYGKTQGD